MPGTISLGLVVSLKSDSSGRRSHTALNALRPHRASLEPPARAAAETMISAASLLGSDRGERPPSPNASSSSSRLVPGGSEVNREPPRGGPRWRRCLQHRRRRPDLVKAPAGDCSSVFCSLVGSPLSSLHPSAAATRLQVLPLSSFSSSRRCRAPLCRGACLDPLPFVVFSIRRR